MENQSSQISTNKPQDSAQKTYSWGLDLIRVVAMFFVVLVHSTTIYGFNDGFSSFPLFLSGMGRWLSYSCIPLFILLTGYLQSNKKPTLDYYIKLIKILIEFFISGFLLATLYWIFFDSKPDFWALIGRMFIFDYPGYSWYINMYVGLFLFAPFFNILYNSLSNKQKIILLISLFVLLSCPQVSSYWGSAYPILYYFIGLFLKEKQFKINKWILAGVIIFGCLWQMLMMIVPLYGVESHNNVGCLVISVAIFLLLYDLKVKQGSKHKMNAAKVLRIIANASVGTFLISQFFESCTEILFNKLALTTFAQKLPYLAYLTPIKFLISVVIGIAISYLSIWIYKLMLFVINKIKARKDKKQKPASAQ